MSRHFSIIFLLLLTVVKRIGKDGMRFDYALRWHKLSNFRHKIVPQNRAVEELQCKYRKNVIVF